MKERLTEAHFLSGAIGLSDGIENVLNDEGLMRCDAKVFLAPQMIDEIMEPLLVRHLQRHLEIFHRFIHGRESRPIAKETRGTKHRTGLGTEDLDIIAILLRLMTSP